eukprot:453145_1
MLFGLLLLLLVSFGCSLGWKTKEISPSNISRLFPNYGAFIAKQNDSIYILGGTKSGTMLIKFNTNTHSFTSHSNTYDFGYQVGQSSIQINHALYMLPYYKIVARDQNMSKLNLNTLQTEVITRYPGHDTRGRCMISLDSYLIIISGLSYHSMFIYDLINGQWLDGISIPSPRLGHSCNIINQTIYLFGGVVVNHALSSDEDEDIGNQPQYLDDIWMLEIDDINICCSTEWIQLTATLSSGKYGHRSIAVENNIYIIGGDQGDKMYLSEVDVFNTETKEISVYSDMIYAKSSHAAVELNSIIYVFGGLPTSTNFYINTQGLPMPNNEYYQYTNLPSNYPTTSPTQNPSSSPTIPSSSALSPNSNSLWIVVGIVSGFIIFGLVYYIYKLKKVKAHQYRPVALNGLDHDGDNDITRTQLV